MPAYPAVGRLRQYPWLFKTCYDIDHPIKVYILCHSILAQQKRPRL